MGAGAYTNDADGNTLTGGGRANSWDAQNRLTGSSLTGGPSCAYTYGADGLRRSSTVTPSGPTTAYAYDGSMLVREMQKNAGGVLPPTATYLQGASGPAYRRDDTATEIDSQGHTITKAGWYVYDGLGSVVGKVDPLGNLTASAKYDVYGAKRAGGTGTVSSRQGFVRALGHVTDAETGLVYMQARYYESPYG